MTTAQKRRELKRRQRETFNRLLAERGLPPVPTLEELEEQAAVRKQNAALNGWMQKHLAK
jgi:hypothetical protein